MPNPGTSFASGFIRGLSGVMASNRQRDTQRQEREQDYMVRGFMSAVQEGVVPPDQIEAGLRFIMGGKDAKGKKGKAGADDPTKQISEILGNALQSTPTSKTSMPFGGAAVSPADVQQGAAPLPQADARMTQDGPRALPMGLLPPEGRTPPTAAPTPSGQPSGEMFGVPVLSREQADAAKIERDLAGRRALAERGAKIAKELVAAGLYDNERDARVSLGLDVDRLLGSASQSQGFTLSAGQKRFDAAGNVIAEGPDRPVNTGSMSTEEQFIAAYAQDRGKTPEALSADERMKARQDWMSAGRAVSEAGDSPAALARMAASNPSVMQGLNPALAGKVLGEIAKNPALLSQFDSSRMESVRSRADTIIQTMNDLVRTDSEGNVLGLTPGASGLYGMGSGRIARFVPGSRTATAKAALDQVTGQMVLDLIGDMKAQSRTGATGFGQLSIRELDVVESAATVLKGEISPDRALIELKRLREQFAKILQPSAAERSGGGSGQPVSGATAETGAVIRDGKLYIDGVLIGEP